ncbi:Uncharacterised protein r2_g131 [Pycnogonum litorale]
MSEADNKISSFQEILDSLVNDAAVPSGYCYCVNKELNSLFIMNFIYSEGVPSMNVLICSNSLLDLAVVVNSENVEHQEYGHLLTEFNRIKNFTEVINLMSLFKSSWSDAPEKISKRLKEELLN